MDLMWLFARLILLFGGLSGGQSFPPKLSPAEEEEAISRMLLGDERARDKLIEHNLRLVAHICKKYAVNGRDMEDLISVGTIGLIKAVQSFDPDKKRPLASFASRCVENEILMALRAERKSRGTIALEEVIGFDKDGNRIVLSDILNNNEESVEKQAEQRIAIDRLYSRIGHVLTPRERVVIELRYGLFGRESLTQREIAHIMGISRSYISRIEKRALQKLGAALEKTTG
jgi:RNA polymerase sporulation-specific sigma factor